MGRYTAVHENAMGAGDERPTALQIIKDEGLEGGLSEKVIVLTGATSGIGLETARALGETGAHLILPVRDIAAAKAGPLSSLLHKAGPLSEILRAGRVSLVEMDSSLLASVRKAAPQILAAANNQVNILINNAGVMGIPDLQLTAEGFETTFATNYLGHFLLFLLLRPALLASASAAFPSRVVNVSSSTHRASPLPSSDNYSFEKGGYNFGSAYGFSKLEQIYMSNEIDRRYGAKHLHATSLHPGPVDTNIWRYMGRGPVEQMLKVPEVAKALKSSAQGAATTVIAAVGEEWAHQGGKYLQNCAEAPPGNDDGSPLGTGYVRVTYDAEAAARLWSDALKILEVPDDSDSGVSM